MPKQINDGGDLGVCGLATKNDSPSPCWLKSKVIWGPRMALQSERHLLSRRVLGVLLGTIRSTHVIYLGVQHNHLVKQGPQECKDFGAGEKFLSGFC